uniref:Uncharacterized protein n=1 Tax=Plectus sambesii TaxID=2011161 RepID=A0A914VLU4_9BILA
MSSGGLEVGGVSVRKSLWDPSNNSKYSLNRLTLGALEEAEPEQYANITEVYKVQNSVQSFNNLPSGYLLYYAGDNIKTTAGTGFYIPAFLAFIRLQALNYSDNNDSTAGKNDENDSGVNNKTTASSYAT